MTLAGLKRHIDRRCATKADLRRFATKADLRRFATKADLRRLEARIELRFATKDDLRQLERRLETRMDVRFADVHRQFHRLEEKIDSLIRYVRGTLEHHGVVLDEHDNRLSDLEAGQVS